MTMQEPSSQYDRFFCSVGFFFVFVFFAVGINRFDLVPMRGRERDDSENKLEYRRLQCGQCEAIYLCIGLRNLRFRNHLLL